MAHKKLLAGCFTSAFTRALRFPTIVVDDLLKKGSFVGDLEGLFSIHALEPKEAFVQAGESWAYVTPGADFGLSVKERKCLVSD